MHLFQHLTPRIGRRYLYMIAAMVWTFAGSMLLFRGMLLFMDDDHLFWIRISISILAGILFYRFLFSRNFQEAHKPDSRDRTRQALPVFIFQCKELHSHVADDHSWNFAEKIGNHFA